MAISFFQRNQIKSTTIILDKRKKCKFWKTFFSFSLDKKRSQTDFSGTYLKNRKPELSPLSSKHYSSCWANASAFERSAIQDKVGQIIISETFS